MEESDLYTVIESVTLLSLFTLFKRHKSVFNETLCYQTRRETRPPARGVSGGDGVILRHFRLRGRSSTYHLLSLNIQGNPNESRMIANLSQGGNRWGSGAGYYGIRRMELEGPTGILGSRELLLMRGVHLICC